MNVMRLWAGLYGKGAISNDNIIIIISLFPALPSRLAEMEKMHDKI